MTLTLLAAGSRGDVQPVVALGIGLAQAGHAVRVVTMANFEPMVRNAGLDYVPIAADSQELVNVTMGAELGDDGLNIFNMLRAIRKSFGSITDAFIAAFGAPELRDSRAILSQLPGGFFGYDLAEALDVPYIALSVIPQEQTAAWPYALLPSRASLGGVYNRLTYPFAKQLIWPLYRKAINDFREQLGLGHTSFMWGNMNKRVPVVQGFSESMVPRPPDWGDHIVTTGYWDMPETAWQPPDDLLAFLAAGPPPVFVGFGSMPISEPAATTRLIIEALTQSDQRGIISAGWADLGHADLPPTIHTIDYAPYKWLFPQMAALVHHGGSGTTGLALRSGRPSMVIPFLADQPYWGSRIHALGVGPAPVPFKNLTVEALAAGITAMLTDTTMQQRTRAMQTAMAGEDGISTAVAHMETLLA